MRLPRLLIPILLTGVTSVLAAHDLFLTLGAYLVQPQATVKIVALNGTFARSENSIARARVADLSLVGAAGRERLDTGAVSAEGPTTAIRVTTGAAGTYVVGLSLHPSEISLKGPEFNAYLTEEGLGAVVEARRAAGELGKPARERYAKHVKVVFQAGESRNNSWNTVLGYPVEIVPLSNPYARVPGDTLRVRLLINGAPAPKGIEAIAGGRTATGGRHPVQHLRADADGTVGIRLSGAGSWYVKFISMTRSTEPGPDYLSQWATLTFGIAPRSDAVLRSGDGSAMGRVSLLRAGNGVGLRVTAKGLAPGEHGVHLHALPQCEGPAFQSAGGHLNPEQKQHGHQNPAGPHLGDLGNLRAGADGNATATLTVQGATMRGLLGDAGIALVIHAGPDDEKTDPSGGSGARVACAVLR